MLWMAAVFGRVGTSFILRQFASAQHQGAALELLTGWQNAVERGESLKPASQQEKNLHETTLQVLY